jgi:hypothetical protein
MPEVDVMAAIKDMFANQNKMLQASLDRMLEMSGAAVPETPPTPEAEPAVPPPPEPPAGE